MIHTKTCLGIIKNLMPSVQKRAWKPHTGQSEDLSTISEKELLLLIRTEEMLVTANADFLTYNSEHTVQHLKRSVSWNDYEDHQKSLSMVSVLAELLSRAPCEDRLPLRPNYSVHRTETGITVIKTK